MARQEKVLYAQRCLGETWGCPADTFSRNDNVFLTKKDEGFLEVVTFGKNAVFRANGQILAWCVENFAKMPAGEILDGDGLYRIEHKMREHGKKLGGEYIRHLRLNPATKIAKPDGFSFTLYEGDQVQQLYEGPRFEHALNYQERGEVLAIVARAGDEIAGIVAVDAYQPGLWQIGINTVEGHRGRGLAGYLVQEIARESEQRGQVPYYATWGANIASLRAAIATGFCPVWTGYFAEDL